MSTVNYEQLAKDRRAVDKRIANAAPDLLEAAKQVVWKLSHNQIDHTGKCVPGTVSRLDATVRMLDEAIAKAEGRGE